MKNYMIVNGANPDCALAYLHYNEENGRFSLHLCKEAKPENMQGMLRVFYEKKMFEPGEAWSERWVKERIIPGERQGLGITLRRNQMNRYDEAQLLEKSRGICVQDDLQVKIC